MESGRDLERKRQIRLDSNVQEKERLSKQTSREKNRGKNREYDKIVKRDKRKDETFVSHESSLKRQTVFGSQLIDCIRKFEEKMSIGPVYICSSCHQTWFSDSVVHAKSIKTSGKSVVSACLTDLTSVDGKEWVCHTCLNALRSNKVPRL